MSLLNIIVHAFDIIIYKIMLELNVFFIITNVYLNLFSRKQYYKDVNSGKQKPGIFF